MKNVGNSTLLIADKNFRFPNFTFKSMNVFSIIINHRVPDKPVVIPYLEEKHL